MYCPYSYFTKRRKLYKETIPFIFVFLLVIRKITNKLNIGLGSLELQKPSSADTPEAWATYVVNRCTKNNNSFFALATGQTGSGKSYSLLSFAELIHKKLGVDFNPKEQIFFKVVDLIKAIKSGKYRKGTTFILDEAQVEVDSARSYMNPVSRMIKDFFSTNRSLNYVVLISAPYSSYIQKSARVLLHAKIQMSSIDPKRKVSRAKFKHIKSLEDQQGNTKTFENFMRIRVTNIYGIGLTKKQKIIEFPLASEEVINLYEEAKLQFQEERYTEMIADLTTTQHPLIKAKIDPRHYVLAYLNKEKGITQEDLGNTIGVETSCISKRIKKATPFLHTLDSAKKEQFCNDFLKNFPEFSNYAEKLPPAF